MVVPGDTDETRAVGFPRQLAHRVVARDVIDGVELERVDLIKGPTCFLSLICLQIPAAL